VSDEFEALLRDHFRQASEGINPGPKMLERARAAGRRRRVHAWSPRLNTVAVGAAGLAAVGGLVVVVTVLPRTLVGHRVDPVARPPEPVTLHAAPTVVPVGGKIRLAGTAPGRIDVFLRIGEHWADVGDATPADGRYSMTVFARKGTSAARACLAGSSACSVTLRLRVVLSPSHIPTPTPTRSHANSPSAIVSPPVTPASPTPTRTTGPEPTQTP
jgi:hypothetical protein